MRRFGARIGTGINIGPGFPFAGNFPVDTLEGAIANTDRFPTHVPLPAHNITVPDTDTTRFTIPKTTIDNNESPEQQIDLATALQYQSSAGLPSLAAFVQDWAVNHQHRGKIPYDSPQTLLTCGSQDAFAKLLMTFADAGDAILVEEAFYVLANEQIPPFGVTRVPVKLDEHGMSSKDLARVLDSWDVSKQGTKPHMMYTVTLGQNPTGTIMPLWRKKEIYAVCQRHDVLIFEDDPYWALQYDVPPPTLRNGKATPPNLDPDKFLASLAPSYVEIDIDGRVLAMQTFTKIFAPGCRVGWIVAQPDFIAKLTLMTDVTTSNPSGFAEAALAQVIRREWNGPEGFVRWIAGLNANYRSRRDVLCETLAEGRVLFVGRDKESGSDSESKSEGSSNDDGDGGRDGSGKRKHRGSKSLARTHRTRKGKPLRMYDFDVPEGGMYVWVNLHLDDHPLARGKAGLSIRDILIRLWNHLITNFDLLTVPGPLFAVDGSTGAKTASHHLRLTFAAVAPSDLRRAGRLFGEGVKTFWRGDGWELPEVTGQRAKGAVGAMKGQKAYDDLLVQLYELHAARKGVQNLGLALGRG